MKADVPDPTIVISVIGSTVHVKPERVEIVKNKNKVTWLCKDGTYAVLFNDDTPFRKKAFAAEAGDDIKTNIADKVGSFKYSVAVVRDNGIFTVDPEIVVDDDKL